MPRQTSRALRWGVGLFAVGVVCIAIDVGALAAGAHNTPLWLNLACLLAPVGFAVAVGSALRTGRSEQQRLLESSPPESSTTPSDG